MTPNFPLKSPGAALRKLFGAAVLGAAALVAPAQATVLDFDDYYGLIGHGDMLEEDGFLMAGMSNAPEANFGDLVGAVLDGSDPYSCISGTCPVNNPTPYYASLNDGLFYLEHGTPGRSFHIRSFDASYIGDNATSYPVIAGLLRIQGFRADNTWMTETYQLAGPVGGAFRFASYNTSATFGQQDFVAAYFFGFTCNSAGSCTAFNSNRGQFALDNITLVPEPSTGLMFGLGVVGLCAFARRRNA